MTMLIMTIVMVRTRRRTLKIVQSWKLHSVDKQISKQNKTQMMSFPPNIDLTVQDTIQCTKNYRPRKKKKKKKKKEKRKERLRQKLKHPENLTFDTCIKKIKKLKIVFCFVC